MTPKRNLIQNNYAIYVPELAGKKKTVTIVQDLKRLLILIDYVDNSFSKHGFSMPKHSIDTGKPHRISQINIDHANQQCHFIVSAPPSTPGIQINDIQAEVIAHLKRVFGRLYDPKGFSIDFKHTGVEFRYTVSDKATVFPAFLKLAKYPTYINKIGIPCINDIQQFVEPEPKQKLKRYSEIGFERGLRTQMHFHAHGEKSDIIEYKSKKYQFLKGDINFSAEAPKPVASVGHTREIILLDPDTDRMQELYQEFEKNLARLGKNIPLEDVFRQARRFSNNKIDNTDFEPDAKARDSVKVGKQNLPIYTLEEIIEQRKGVCRHHALFTAFLLGQYIRKQSVANTSVYHCRDSWTHPRKNESVAHTWVVCKQNNSLFLIDSMWNVQYNLADYTEYSKACQAYTKEVIDRTLKRAHLNPPAPVALSPLPKPVVDMELPKDPASEKTEQLKAALDLLEEADCEVVRQLIAQGADVNAQGVKGWTAAHVAARKDDRSLILFLKEKNANFNLKSARRQRSPLFYAQNRAMIELLVDYGADPFQEDATPQRITPLRHHEKLISANDLLKSEIDKLNGANPELIKKLIRSGADVNAQGEYTGWTAAHLAADKNDVALLQLLIQKKADFNLKSHKRGRSPLFYAQTREMVLFLVTNGANLLQEDATSTTTPLKQLLAKRIVSADELLKNELNKRKAADRGVIKALVEAGARVNTQGSDSGWTAVHCATALDDATLLEFLIKRNADLNLKSTTSQSSPLFYARSATVAKLLISHQADYKQTNSMQPAYQVLMTSPHLNSTAMSRFLLSHELEKTGFNNISAPFLAICTPKDHAQQIKLLHALGCFLEGQVQRLDKLSRFTKGVDDKARLYRSLIDEIRNTLKEGDLGNDTMKNLIYQTATISHHRRYRSSNKAAAFFSAGCYSVDAKSWKDYKAWVSNFNTADRNNPFKTILSDSTAIRKNRLVITLPTEDGVTEVKGYEAYRSKKLSP